MTSVQVSSNGSRYGQDVAIRQFQLVADEPTQHNLDGAEIPAEIYTPVLDIKEQPVYELQGSPPLR